MNNCDFHHITKMLQLNLMTMMTTCFYCLVQSACSTWLNVRSSPPGKFVFMSWKVTIMTWRAARLFRVRVKFKSSVLCFFNLFMKPFFPQISAQNLLRNSELNNNQRVSPHVITTLWCSTQIRSFRHDLNAQKLTVMQYLCGQCCYISSFRKYNKHFKRQHSKPAQEKKKVP